MIGEVINIGGVGGRWFNGRAVLFHLTLLVVVPGCLIAAWWQLHEALGGNGLSWAYTFEWPIFAGIAVWAWWHLIHEDPAERDERARQADLDERLAIAASVALGLVPKETDLDADLTGANHGEEYAAKVAEAARREYQEFLSKQAESERANSWRNPSPAP